MAKMSNQGSSTATQTKEQKEAGERMALFPAGEDNGGVEVIFVKNDIWVVCGFSRFPLHKYKIRLRDYPFDLP